MALHQDHLINQSKEDNFLISGLNQVGQPAFGPPAQKAAGRAVMTSLLTTVFPGSDPPVIRDVSIVIGPVPPRGSNLPLLIFVFDTPKIARDVRYHILQYVKTCPALEHVFTKPVLTQATRVCIQILLAIRKCLVSRDVVSYLRRFDCSPSLVVTHDRRDKVYGFVKACTEFRSMLTSDCLRFAYSVASRDFVDRMAPLFIVLTDGGQPLSTFIALTIPGTVQLPIPSGSASNAVATVAPTGSKSNFCFSLWPRLALVNARMSLHPFLLLPRGWPARSFSFWDLFLPMIFFEVRK